EGGGGWASDVGGVVGRGRPPQREAFLRGFQRLVEIGLAGMGQMRQRLLGRRIEHVLALAAAAVHPLAVDVEREIGIHGAPRCSRHCRDTGGEGISIFPRRIPPPPGLACHSGQGKPAPESGREWGWVWSAFWRGVCGMPACPGGTVERWNSPQKHPAVRLDVLPGNEARAGTAKETHGGG